MRETHNQPTAKKHSIFPMNSITEKLQSRKELAAELGRSVRYIASMKARGFQMPGGRATVSQALEWLAKNPTPCRRCATLHPAAHLTD